MPLPAHTSLALSPQFPWLLIPIRARFQVPDSFSDGQKDGHSWDSGLTASHQQWYIKDSAVRGTEMVKGGPDRVGVGCLEPVDRRNLLWESILRFFVAEAGLPVIEHSLGRNGDKQGPFSVGTQRTQHQRKRKSSGWAHLAKAALSLSGDLVPHLGHGSLHC